MKYVLDTCVVSELRRRQPNPSLLDWLSNRVPNDLFLASATVGELRSGACSVPEVARRTLLEKWVDDAVLPKFAGRVLPFDLGVADCWGRLMGDGIASGRTPAVIDSMIAATALVNDMTLVTRNVRDFRFAGLSVVNPFGDAAPCGGAGKGI